MQEEEIVRWITWRGRHIPIGKDGKIIQREITSEKLSYKEYINASNDFYNSLTDKEKKFLQSYTQSGLRFSNANDPTFFKTIRLKSENKRGYAEKKVQFGDIVEYDLDKSIQDEYNYWEYSYVKKEVETMDNIFKNKGISFDKNIEVYRRGQETLKQAKEGFVKKGYISTTQKNYLGKKLPSGRVLGENEFVIVVPAGMKVLPLYGVAYEDVKYQNEVLLNRNLEYNYLKEENGKIYVIAKEK